MHSSYNSLLEYITVRPPNRTTNPAPSRTFATYPSMAAFHPCQERFATRVTLYGGAFMAGYLCVRNAAPPWWPTCLGAPNAGLPPVHLLPRTMCDFCRGVADILLRRRERRRLVRQVVARGPSGRNRPRYIRRRSGIKTLLCKFCEADEIEQYKRRVATGVAPPPTNHLGWEETCTCQEARIRRLAGGKYCIACRGRVLHAICTTANLERRYRGLLARNGAGVLVTASPALRARRAAKGKDIACRCGRDTVEATPNPKVLQCLCCNGVTIDRSQVKDQRDTQANILRRSALPAGHKDALPVLRFAGLIGGLLNLALPAVNVNNNRKR